MRASESKPCTTQWAENAVDRVFEALSAMLAEDQVVRIPEFGTFRRKLRRGGQRRNPKTGEPVTTLDRHVITFKEARPKR